MTRSELNQKIGALAFGRLKLDEEFYRTIVASIDPKSEGHVTHCDDEHANLVLIALRRLADKNPPHEKNVAQQKFIARLMDYLKWNWKTTAEFCERQTGKKTTRACTAFELTKTVNGMIAIIDHDIATGRIALSPAALEQYRHYTQHHRSKQSTTNKEAA
jgi:hypothetical protein